MHQWLKYEIWPGRRYLMEESVTEGQQNYIQSKQCLVCFALLSSFRSRYDSYPIVKLGFYYSHEGHFFFATSKKKYVVFFYECYT